MKMPHESYIEQTTDRDAPSPLSPLLNAKLSKKHAQRRTHRVREKILSYFTIIMLSIIMYICILLLRVTWLEVCQSLITI